MIRWLRTAERKSDPQPKPRLRCVLDWDTLNHIRAKPTKGFRASDDAVRDSRREAALVPSHAVDRDCAPTLASTSHTGPRRARQGGDRLRVHLRERSTARKASGGAVAAILEGARRGVAPRAPSGRLNRYLPRLATNSEPAPDATPISLFHRARCWRYARSASPRGASASVHLSAPRSARHSCK